MTLLPPDRWPDVERLFEAALADMSRTTSLLSAADPAVAAEVRALLEAEAEAEAFFERPAAGLPLPDVPDVPAPDLMPGTLVGPWTVEAEIGRGGMATVYRARRADGAYDQAVALKVVRRGMDSDVVVRRFRQERALLAALAHPYIARLIDGGTTPDGRPYLALDLVDGEPITAYADAHRLPVEERLHLFLQVCDAVAHAHRHLVVHRDLKPSNLLVAEGDTGRHVVLLDFGIAKLLEARGGAEALTGEGPGPLTPEYAAPEQLDGGPISTATDVYALGVVLYELLTGHRHRVTEGWGTAGRSRPLGSTVRPSLATGRAPGPRSPRPAGQAATPAAVAAARGTTPERLQRRLRGDLDAICLRALRPEPAARYPSVDALAEDVRRHLGGRPVSARQGTARYVAGKMLRRHWLPIGAAVLIVALLAGSAADASLQSRRLARERDKAEAVAAILERFIIEADPGGRRGEPATVRELLGAGADQIQTLEGDPEVKAHLLDVMGRVYRALADYDRAYPMQREAVRLYASARGSDDPKTLLARHHLAYLLAQMGRTAEAEDAYRAVLAARRASGDPDGLVESTSDLAGLLLQLDRPVEASDLAREGLAVLDRHPDAGPPDLEGPLSKARFLSILGRAHGATGRLGEAERLLRQSLALTTQEMGADHTYAAMTRVRLAQVLAARGRNEEAERLFGLAAEVQERTWGPDHPWTLDALLAWAAASADAGKTREADQRFSLVHDRAVAAGDSVRAANAARQSAALARSPPGGGSPTE